MLSNIWVHWKTSAAGVLLAVATVCGVLSQQGVTLGNAGTGTIVALVAAIATALLGLLARDPGAAGDQAGNLASQQKLGALMLCALLTLGTVPVMAGCNGVTVAQDIVNWTPALQQAIGTVDATASLLVPADALIFTAATGAFDAASNVLVAQCQAYLANPTAPLLAQLQTQVVTFEQQVNAALLGAARIMNPNSQQQALAAIQGVGTIVAAILALVSSISTPAAKAQMAAAAKIKIAEIEPLTDPARSVEIVTAHYHLDGDRFPGGLEYYEAGLSDLQRAGF